MLENFLENNLCYELQCSDVDKLLVYQLNKSILLNKNGGTKPPFENLCVHFYLLFDIICKKQASINNFIHDHLMKSISNVLSFMLQNESDLRQFDLFIDSKCIVCFR
jgi:hypothetical protein